MQVNKIAQSALLFEQAVLNGLQGSRIDVCESRQYYIHDY